MKILIHQLLIIVLFISAVNAEEFEQGISVTAVSSQQDDRLFYMDATIETHLPLYMTEAVYSGVLLPLLLQIQVKENNEWWFDRSLVTIEHRLVLHYYPLLSVFRLNNLTTGASSSHSTLALALKKIGTLHHFPILDKEHFKTDHQLYARIRLKVDASALPKPLRTNSLLGGSWELSSEWKEFPLS